MRALSNVQRQLKKSSHDFAAADSEEEEEVGEYGELLDEEKSEELLSEDESIRTDGRTAHTLMY